MSNPTQLPLSLYKANLELQARIAKLIQEGGRLWLELGQRAYEDGIAECDAEIGELLKAGDWQKLASLPAESFWRQLEQRFGDGQATMQAAIGAQTAFASGLQDAVRAWQQDTALVLGNNPLAAPFDSPMFDSPMFDNAPFDSMLKPWQPPLSPADAVAPSSSAKPGAKTGRSGRG